MIAPPDTGVVLAFLARARRRVAWRVAANGVSAGIVLSLVVALVARRWPPAGLFALLAALALLGVIVSRWISRTWRANVSRIVEARAPQCRNLLITADELIAAGATGYVPQIVTRDAARITRSVDLAEVLPLRGAVAGVIAAAAVWVAAATLVAAPADSRIASIRAVAVRGAAVVSKLDVNVTPPAYTGRSSQLLRDPSRIEALAGSRIKLDIDASADRVVVETIRGADTLRALRPGYFSSSLVPDADGFISIQALAGDGTAGPRKLIGLTAIPDAAPRVRITAPARDLFLRDVRSVIDLAVDANDDIGLASLRLKYTKVSGSGERFTFTDGELPLTITKRDAKAWVAHARWSLAPLGLESGDMVVYRAIATDARPNAPVSESDSYIAEIVAPGGVAAAGFSTDPEQERYAVSQQMVILKSERLLAKGSSMTPDAFANESQEIAIEQRKVRAEFVFMLGGELADAPDISSSMTDLNEEAEAAGESDLLAGHAANAGHLALLRAIRAMSRASTALNVADVGAALPHERAALTQLEQAFSRARIILRALTERERLDLSRRLTGALTDASRDVRPTTAAAPDVATLALRRVLANIASLPLTADAARQAGDLAQQVLQVNPSEKTLQNASAALANATNAMAARRMGDARGDIDRAATLVAGVLRGGAAAGSLRPANTDARVLEGALRDALVRRP